MAASQSGDLPNAILQALSKSDQIISSDAFPSQTSTDLQAALLSLASKEMVTYDTINRDDWTLLPEAEGIAQNGSHEARIFEALRKAVDGLSISELETAVGDKQVVKFGQGKGRKAGWIGNGKDGKLVAKVDSITDTTQEQLKTIQKTRTHPDAKVLDLLKKQKLVKPEKVITYKIHKGPKFSLEIVKEEADLTADMIASYVSYMSMNGSTNWLLQWCMEDSNFQAIQLQSTRIRSKLWIAASSQQSSS